MPHSDTRLWHPFADMHAVRSSELTIVSGEGVHVTDDEGRRYLDGTASLWYVNVGHGRPEIADAAAEQMRELETYSCFGDVRQPPALELAERLARLAPSTARASSSPAAAATRSTPRPSSPAATSPRSASPSACT